MDDRDQLKRRYADVLDAAPDDDLLQMVDELHEAAVLCRLGQPSAAVDQAIGQLARRRRASTPTDAVDPVVDFEVPAQMPEKTPPPTRLRSGWFRQSLGMVATILVLVLVGAILAVTFGNQRQSQQGGIGGGPTATTAPSLPTPDASGQYTDLTFAQAQQLALSSLSTVPPTSYNYYRFCATARTQPYSRQAHPQQPGPGVSVNFRGPYPEPPVHHPPSRSTN